MMKRRLLKTCCSSMLVALALGLVADPAVAILVTRNISGIWDLPDQERHGMTITVTQLASGEKTVVVYLATYDGAGQPTWFAAQTAVQGDTISGPLYRVSGPGFLDPVGTPSNFEQVGSMQVQFSDCDNGVVSYQTPSDVVGTGGFRIQRISNLFQESCTGGVSDDTPAMVGVSEFRIYFNNTGLDTDASGRADFEERADRTEFSVQVEDLNPGTYSLLVDGVVQADIAVETTANGTQGEIEFRSPVEPGKTLLTFDPRGAVLEIVQANMTYLSTVLPMQGGAPPPPAGGGTPPPFGNMRIELDLNNQGAIPGADGDAELEQRSDRVDFDVEIEDVPVGDYQLFVSNTLRATISVVNTPSGPEGEVEFRNPVESGKLLLDFDPRGEMIRVEQNGLAILAGVFPTMGGSNGGGDDGGSDDDDDNGGGGDDSGGSGGGGTPSNFTVSVPFVNQGPDSDASGTAEYESRSDRTEFKVEAEDLDDGMYDIVVAGTTQAVLVVNGGEGEVEFRDPVEAGKLPLDFNPLGQTVAIVQGGVTYLSVQMPSP